MQISFILKHFEKDCLCEKLNELLEQVYGPLKQVSQEYFLEESEDSFVFVLLYSDWSKILLSSLK